MIPPRELPRDDRTLARALGADLRRRREARLVEAAAADADAEAGRAIDAAIERHDPHCRGVLVLGLEASAEDLRESFASPRRSRCRGFAVGRSIFADAAGRLVRRRDAATTQVVADVAARYARLVALWRRGRAPAGRSTSRDHSRRKTRMSKPRIGFIGSA